MMDSDLQVFFFSFVDVYTVFVLNTFNIRVIVASEN